MDLEKELSKKGTKELRRDSKGYPLSKGKQKI